MPKPDRNQKSLYFVFSFDTGHQEDFCDLIHTDCMESALLIAAHIRPYCQGFSGWTLSGLRAWVEDGRTITVEETAAHIKEIHKESADETD